MKDYKNAVKDIIAKLTQDRSSVFSQRVFSEASEFGIGEGSVIESLNLLKEENFIHEPVPGVLKRY